MSTETASVLALRVVEARALGPLVRLLRLRAAHAAPLPGFEPGAHVRVAVRLADGRHDWRPYSLINFSLAPDACAAPAEYVIAVRRDERGGGGSLFMHDGLAAGQVVEVEAPRNRFPLAVADASCLLIAGGIGVTPLTAMATACVAAGRPVRMVYAGHSRERMAFVEELQGLLGDALVVHASAQAGARLDVAGVLHGVSVGEGVYVCGPASLIAEVRADACRRGWSDDRVRYELFQAPAAEAGDEAFEVVLARSGRVLAVPPDRSILDCMIDAGLDPLFDCRNGDCGVCAMRVIEGCVDHRDHVLSESERSSGDVIQVCVSRCRGPRLVLDS